jgi:anti-sigma factor RsiW
MSECRELEPLLAAYVDGEVAPPDAAHVQAHLSSCPPCRRRVEGERAVRGVLQARRHELVPAAPAGLRRRCAAAGPAALSTASVGRRRLAPGRWVPLSFAASVLLAVAAVFFMGLNGGVEALATQLALDHIKCFQFAPEHTEVDSKLAGDAWHRSYAWLINVPRSEPVEQLELLGVRRCLSTQGASAHIMYRWRGHPLSMYVLNSQPKAAVSPERLVSRVGQEAVIWTDAGRTYAVVSRGQRADLERIAHHMRASAR